jgi:hypothetical protein
MASIKQFEERNDNISSIISFVRSNQKVTRREICNALSMSWACVFDLVAILIADGILIESNLGVKTSSTEKGRNPSYLSLNEKKYFLGIDINDSGFAITSLSINGEIIASKKWEAETFSTEEELELSVCKKISEFLYDKKNCCGIGVAMEGLRSENGGFYYPIANKWLPVSPQVFIANHFELPVSIRHDPECVLYSVAHTCQDCMVVRVDNWIGVAAMKRGKILDLPLELGSIRYGNQKLHTILHNCAQNNDYYEIAEALGRSAGNLTVLLGIKTCFLAGKVTEWLERCRDKFDTSFREANPRGEYKICLVSDASDGAARLALADFPSLQIITTRKGLLHNENQ